MTIPRLLNNPPAQSAGRTSGHAGGDGLRAVVPSMDQVCMLMRLDGIGRVPRVVVARTMLRGRRPSLRADLEDQMLEGVGRCGSCVLTDLADQLLGRLGTHRFALAHHRLACRNRYRDLLQADHRDDQ